MRWLLELLRALLRSRPRELVRPWAMLAPAVVLLVTLPLLRPLRHPDPSAVGDDELALLATTQSLVEQGTLAIDGTPFAETRKKFERPGHPAGSRWYADQPPTLAYLLSAPYRAMHWYGLTFAADGARVAYVLTLLGSAVPAAAAAGLVYRMSRLFELPRPWRALLAGSAVFSTGLVSYATVLNAHVPAAALLMASAACLTHLAISLKRPFVPLWLFAAGLTAALAAAVDPSAVPFLPLLWVVIVGYPWPRWRRAGGLAAFALGAAGPIALHAALTVPVTGDLFQGMGFAPVTPVPAAAAAPPWVALPPVDPPPTDEPDDARPGGAVAQAAAGLLAALLGAHGLLSHFPVLVLGAAGVGMVMHRHWPTAAKVLAAGTLAGAVFLLVAYAVHRPPGPGWRDAMFAARWFVAFGPLTLFWAGAWLRRRHRPATWAAAGGVLTFSTAVGLVGAAHPWPPGGYDRYTAAEALARLVGTAGPPASPPPWPTAPPGTETSDRRGHSDALSGVAGPVLMGRGP